MKIESVEKYKGSTYCVIFDDESRIYIGSEIVSKYNLRAGLNLPQEAVEDIITDNGMRKARERALYLLDGRDYSYIEMLNKLKATYSEEVAFATCDRLAQRGLIDDRRYAERLAQELCERKHFGPYRARQELNKRGIPDKLIAEVLTPYNDADERAERLEELVKRKYARYLGDESGQKKVTSALVRMGYSYGEIRSLLKRLECDSEEEYDGYDENE